MDKPLLKDVPISGQLRENKSATAHLPKGTLARKPKPVIMASLLPVTTKMGSFCKVVTRGKLFPADIISRF